MHSVAYTPIMQHTHIPDINIHYNVKQVMCLIFMVVCCDCHVHGWPSACFTTVYVGAQIVSVIKCKLW